MDKKIAIIGGGNLGSAIAHGIIKKEFLQPNQITITRRNTAALTAFEQLGANVTADNLQAIAHADYVILAIKPYQVQSVLETLVSSLNIEQQTLVSVVTGVSLHDFATMLPSGASVIRAMPNTAIALGESMTCIAANDNCTQEQVAFVMNMFDQVGATCIIDEELMDAATVLGACGTAYAMRYIRAGIQGGIEIGFSAAVATKIVAQTLKGAAQIILQNDTHPEAEIDKVTTPKGCTIAGLNEMEHHGFSSSLIKGIKSSYLKIKNDM